VSTAKAFRTAVLSAILALCATAPAHAGATQASKTIFYSGGGHAGEDSGSDAGAWVMVEKPFKDYEVWRGTSDCNSNRAVPRRPSRTFTRLVGYSLGRLGPAYYLQQMEQRHVVSAVRSVILLDPGVAEEFDCDDKSGAGYTYATWLRQNPANRLLIINGEATAADKYKGLRDTYLSKLTAQTVGANVGDRVLVCDIPSIKHRRMDEAWKHLIPAATQTGCPEPTTPSRYSPKSKPGAAPPPPPPPSDPGPVGGSPQVSVGQGPAAPQGYRYAISISGFAGGSQVTIVCRDSVDPGGFYTFPLGVDGAGNGSTASQCYSGDGPDHWVTANGIESNHVSWGGGGAPPPPPPPAQTWAETTGGVTHTWTNYTNAGGYEGPTIASNATVQIACKLSGFRVADGNTWWYRIASDPWSGNYYASADAFYNNGQTSGSLLGTPFVDPSVRDC
jgi:hypothetical protein